MERKKRKMKPRYSAVKSPKGMFAIVTAIIVIGIGILILTSLFSNAPAASFAEGTDYDLKHVGQGRYQIIDEDGNIVDLRRVSPEIFQDSKGRRYIFVSGSPYKYMGMD